MSYINFYFFLGSLEYIYLFVSSIQYMSSYKVSICTTSLPVEKKVNIKYRVKQIFLEITYNIKYKLALNMF